MSALADDQRGRAGCHGGFEEADDRRSVRRASAKKMLPGSTLRESTAPPAIGAEPLHTRRPPDVAASAAGSKVRAGLAVVVATSLRLVPFISVVHAATGQWWLSGRVRTRFVRALAGLAVSVGPCTGSCPLSGPAGIGGRPVWRPVVGSVAGLIRRRPASRRPASLRPASRRHSSGASRSASIPRSALARRASWRAARVRPGVSSRAASVPRIGRPASRSRERSMSRCLMAPRAIIWKSS